MKNFLLLTLLFISCEREEPPQFNHITTFEIRFGNGEIDTVSCEYVSEFKDAPSYYISKNLCIKCGQYILGGITTACDVTKHKVISDSSSPYKNPQK